MMLRYATLGALICGVSLSGCGLGAVVEQNPFVILSEEFGVAPGTEPPETPGAGGGTSLEEKVFRKDLTVSFANNHDEAEVDTSFAAWVNVGSIRSAEQQDALLSGGYVQLTRDIRLGTAFVLPVGTFVYNGPGVAGATAVRLGCPASATGIPLTSEVTLVTPDVFLVFSQPPVSCDSVAFSFRNLELGQVVTGPVTGIGGFKTFAQVDVYECDPLRPGLFLKLGGGVREPNEFFEGSEILFEFNKTADGEGNFAIVTITE